MPPGTRPQQSARDCIWASKCPGQASVQRNSLEEYVRRHVHAGAKLAVPVFSRLEHNFHRNFQGNKSMEPGVLGLVHHTHAASAKSFEDAVARDGLADESVGVRHSAVMLGDELR